jgi:hypothetical protein
MVVLSAPTAAYGRTRDSCAIVQLRRSIARHHMASHGRFMTSDLFAFNGDFQLGFVNVKYNCSLSRLIVVWLTFQLDLCFTGNFDLPNLAARRTSSMWIG